MVALIVIALFLFIVIYNNIIQTFIDGTFTPNEIEILALNFGALIPIVTAMVKAADVLFNRLDLIIKTKQDVSLLTNIRTQTSGYKPLPGEWHIIYRLVGNGLVVFNWDRNKSCWVVKLNEG